MPKRAAIRRSGSIGPLTPSASGSTRPAQNALLASRGRARVRDATASVEPFARAEVVGEFDAFLLLAGHDRRLPLAAIPEELAQTADELRILGKPFHQNPPRAVERGGEIARLWPRRRSRGRLLGNERRICSSASARARDRPHARFCAFVRRFGL
jgi:hypothetical protein